MSLSIFLSVNPIRVFCECQNKMLLVFPISHVFVLCGVSCLVGVSALPFVQYLFEPAQFSEP